ncbi:MAG TPA: response regulator [Candidatus Limnocylindria bacterium]|nr:response regulator [Candidatus Limnocylindria bacterium]
MKYVLIAEDDPDISALIADGISDHLYVATHVVANGALVPDAVAVRRPDLLILDVNLPGLSGLDVFDLVRSDPHYSGIPVLFLTASPERAESAFSPSGEHRVMAKPFDVDELVAVVDRMLDGRAVETAA